MLRFKFTLTSFTVISQAAKAPETGNICLLLPYIYTEMNAVLMLLHLAII